jgi:hemolysin III
MNGVAEEPAPRTGDLLPASAPAVPAVKPLLRGWLHLISFEASPVLGTLALANAHGAMRITAIAVFAASALYRRGNWAAAWHRRLQRLDHAIAAHGTARVAGLATIWALTLTAGAIHMA